MSASQKRIGDDLPREFSLSVITQKSPSANRWQPYQWEAVGVLATGTTANSKQAEMIYEQQETSRYLHAGFKLRLHQDECESYYHNLLSANPCCYVVADMSDDGTPTPFMVSFSFDEAHAYLEGDEAIYAVPVPAEIYQWAEAFVLAHYVPTKRSKRKRADWRKSERDSHGAG
ncbi:MAG: DUF3305 domain-containing protein [Candidatus Thiodiazotropha lotti]|nr:DUF3305 domain-containing protein [Candidatus Thiodiazotropha lotti]MCW4221544.1 DUF3305 domain-containing protein [Candidatus Thiodiazotropha lotti]